MINHIKSLLLFEQFYACTFNSHPILAEFKFPACKTNCCHKFKTFENLVRVTPAVNYAVLDIYP